MKHLLPLLSVLALAACGSPGGNAPSLPLPSPVASASAAPVQSPTPTPTVAPTASPVPLALRSIAGAPLTATLAQLKSGRRTQAQGVTNGLPILVESSGMIAAWAGDFGVWTSNASTGQDIPQTSMTVTPSGNLPINNPAPTALSCLGVVSAMCAVHPTAFQFGTSSANGKPVGKQTITVAFSDGTTGTTDDYVYDGWNLPCNSGWVYTNGVPVSTTTLSGSDVYADCTNGVIKFPQGAMQIATPVQDQYGRYETIMPTLTTAFIEVSLFTNAPMPSIGQGQVFGVVTRDGGFAKVYFGSQASATATNSVSGMALYANPDGSYRF